MTTPQAAVHLEPLRLEEKGPRVVAIGGGHGLAQVLEAVQAYAGEITAVVSVSDDGGSSGRLTSDLGIPPPGDIRRCLTALSPEPSIWGELFAYRFEAGDVGGHSLGNLMLAGLSDLLGDFGAAVYATGHLLGATGRVLPVADRYLPIQAVIDGVVVDGQHAISKTKGTFEALRLLEGAAANPEAVAAIRAADQVILGPGSLFTSVLATLIVPGIVEAIVGSQAIRVFVLNLITQDAETLGLDGPGHLEALRRLGGLGGPGVIVANQGPLPFPPGAEPIHLDAEVAERLGWRLVTAQLVDAEEIWPQHDPIRLGRALGALV